MTVNTSANSVILILLFAFLDNLSAENSKLSADFCNRGNHLLGCMIIAIKVEIIVIFIIIVIFELESIVTQNEVGLQTIFVDGDIVKLKCAISFCTDAKSDFSSGKGFSRSISPNFAVIFFRIMK